MFGNKTRRRILNQALEITKGMPFIMKTKEKQIAIIPIEIPCMKVLFMLVFTVLCSGVSRGQRGATDLSALLAREGFENIRILEKDQSLVLSVENKVYRSNVQAIAALVDSVALWAPEKELKLYFLQNDVPALQLKVSLAKWKNRKKNTNPISDPQWLLIDRGIDADWNKLKRQPAKNPQNNKIDFVLYPQLRITNRLLTQLYEVQFNLAPTMEVMLWKGMVFTAQVIFPLSNEAEILDIYENIDELAEERNFLYLSNEGDYIRPGFVTISQDFRLPKKWFGNLTVGNFNSHRYGINVRANHYFKGDKWSITASAGLTGSSHFYQGQWVRGSLNTMTWKVKTGYFYPRYNLQLELSYGSYINNDKGVRADCIRHFGNTSIGFYAMYTGGESNGGFKFTIPLPTAKRKRNKALRIMAPYYFDSDYNAAYAVYYGKDFETRPNENQTEHFNNPTFVKKQLINNFLNNSLK